MTQRTVAQAKQPATAPAQQAGKALQRRCACGNHSLAGECEHCAAQRALSARQDVVNVPPIPPAPPASPPANEPPDPRPSLVHARVKINDTDPQRAEATRLLLVRLIDQLGLDPDSVQIRLDAEAARRTTQRDAAGLMDDGTVYLDPGRFDPARPAGRALLGHELAHVVQRGNNGRSSARASLAAEREARSVARAVAVGRAPAPLRATLAMDHVAADTGDGPETLVETVRQSRARELERIRDLLRTSLFDWFITDGDVNQILTILAGMPFATARAVVAALEPEQRHDLVNNIGSGHFRNFRPQVLACYAALGPDQVARFDEDLLQDMSLQALSPEEREAVVYVLRNLSRRSLRELLDPDSRNRDAIRRLMVEPVLSDEEREAVAQRAVQAQAAERAAQAERAARSQRFDGDPNTRTILEYVRAHIGNPADAIDKISAVRSDEAQVRYIAETLEEEQLLDRLVEDLDEEDRYEPDARRKTFLLLLRFRPQWKNVALVERLLSTHILDWAVRPAEARFAYQIVRQLPLDAQDRFRRYDNGRWLRSLEEHIGEEAFRSGEYRGIEVHRREDQLVDLTERYAELLSVDAENQRHLNVLLALAQRGIDEYTAPQIFLRLRAVHEAHPGRAPGGGPTLLEAIVHRLDSQGYIDRLFDELPRSLIFAEAHRATTLRIMLARDPIHAAQHARQLLQQDIFNAVTAREAYLAYQLVRALPDAERERFIADESGLWSRITEEMTDQMLLSSDLNAFVEREGGATRAGIVAQLMERATWSTDNAARLQGLIRMAIALGERRTVFLSSRRFEAYRDERLRPIVERYGLYDPSDPARRSYQPENFEPAAAEGLFQWLAEFGTAVVAFFHTVGSLLLRSQVDLSDVQEMAAFSLSSARMLRVAEQEPVERPAPASEEGERRQVVSNRVTLRVDIHRGLVDAELPLLHVEEMNLHLAGANVQTGTIRVSDLRVQMGWRTQEFDQPTYYNLQTASVDLEDLLYISRGSLTAANRVGIRPLRFATSSRDVTSTEGSARPRGWHAQIPIFGPLVRIIVALLNLRDRDTDPLHEVDLSFGQLAVEGMNVNGQQQVGGLEVRDVHLHAGVTRSAYLRGLIASLRRRIARVTEQARQEGEPPDTAEMEQRIADAEAELERLEPEEREFLTLRQRAQEDPASLTPDEQRRLTQLRDRMRGGAVLDVGGVRVTGVEGRVRAGDVTLSDLHGEGEGMDLALLAGPALLTDPEILQQFADTRDPRALRERALEQGAFRLDIGNLHTDRLEILAGIPTVEELQNQLRRLEPVRGLPSRAHEIRRLERRLEWARTYERFAARDLSRLSDTERAAFLHAREQLTREVLLRTGAVDLEGARLGVNLAQGGLTFGARQFSAQDVEMPERGLRVEAIEGREVETELSGAPGLAGLLGLPAGLTGGGLRAQELTARGVRLMLNEQALRDELTALRALPPDQLNDSQRQRMENIERLMGALRSIAELRRQYPDREDWDAVLRDYMTRLSVETVSAEGLDLRARGGLAGLLGGEETRRGVELAGAEGGPLFEQLTLSGVRQRDPLRGTGETAVQEVRFGRTTGRINLGRDAIHVQDVGIEQAELSGLFFTSSTLQISGENNVQLHGITLTGTLRFAGPQPGATPGSEAAQNVTYIDLERLSINRVEGRRLSYFDIASNLQVDLNDGALTGIEVQGVSIALPDVSEMRVSGGRAEMRTAEGLDFQAAWVNGVRRARGRLGARGLAVAFAEDGAITVDLQALSLTRGRLTDEDLNLGVNLNARGIHAHIRGDRTTARIADLSGRVRGRAGSTRLDATIEHADTGTVTFTDERIDVPALRVPLITLNGLDYHSESMRVRVPEGGTATVQDLRAALTVELNPPPAGGQAAAGGSRLRRIVIREFVMPMTTVRGLNVTLNNIAGGNLTITLPAGERATIRGLRLLPLNEGDQGFIIQPGRGGEGWETVGELGVDTFDVRRLRAALAGTFSATTDVHGSDLSIRLLDDGRKTIHLGQLILTQIEGEAMGSRFRVVRSGTRHAGVVPGLEVREGHVELVRGPSGETALQEVSAGGISLQGFVVEYPPGIYVDVRRAQLPQGLRFPSGGPVTVPAFSISDAYFRIDDVMALARGSGGGGSGAGARLQNYRFLDRLGGHIFLDLYLPLPYIQRIQDVFPVRMLIVDGRINFENLEDQTLGMALDAVVDFEVRGNQLVLEFDASQLANALLPPLGPLSSLARTDLVTWTLREEGELAEARRGIVRLRRLIRPDRSDPDTPTSSESSLGDVDQILAQMELRNVDASLNLFGESTIDLGPMGRIHMGAPGHDGVSRLQVRGTSSSRRGLELSMQEAIVRLENLVLGGATINTGGIIVQDVRDTTMTFEQGLPKRLEGTIGAATAHNIRVNLPQPTGEE
jgi:hypothetical protein